MSDSYVALCIFFHNCESQNNSKKRKKNKKKPWWFESESEPEETPRAFKILVSILLWIYYTPADEVHLGLSFEFVFVVQRSGVTMHQLSPLSSQLQHLVARNLSSDGTVNRVIYNSRNLNCMIAKYRFQVEPKIRKLNRKKVMSSVIYRQHRNMFTRHIWWLSQWQSK